MLTVDAEHKTEEGGENEARYAFSERSFHRSFSLEGVEEKGITAEYKNGRTVISDSEFTDRRNARQEAALVSSYLSADDRVFFVHQGEDGQDWFAAVFDFYPILVDYSGDTAAMFGGGGTLGLAELDPGGDTLEHRYYHAYTAEELAG